MTNNNDAKTIRESVEIVDFIRRELGGDNKTQVISTGIKSLCPFHQEHSPSFSVSRKHQKYKCFGCGEAGDVIDFVMKYRGKTFAEALAYLGDKTLQELMSPVKRSADDVTKKEITWVPILPVPEGKVPTGHHWQYGQASKIWYYKGLNGELLYCVCRWDGTENGKEILPLVWARRESDGKEDWRYMAPPRPRPMYGLWKLTEFPPNAPIMLVEGEKCADFAQAMFPKTILMSWQGGSNAWTMADFSPLAGRNIWAWPDNDWPGEILFRGVQGERETKSGLFHHLTGAIGVKSIRYINPPGGWGPGVGVRDFKGKKGRPKGWDLADAAMVEGASPEDVLGYAKVNVSVWGADGFGPLPEVLNPKKKTPKDEILAEIASAPAPPPAPMGVELVVAPPAVEKAPPPPVKMEVPVSREPEDPSLGLRFFQIMGYEKQGTKPLFYFYNIVARQMYAYTASELSDANMISLAPINVWEGIYAKRNGGFDGKRCLEWLTGQAYKAGAYNPDRIRGRGVWMDGDDFVAHLGEKLSINGKTEVSINSYHSPGGYVYEADMGLRGVTMTDTIITREEAGLFRSCFNLLNWERDVSSALAVGWCLLAPVCGVLRWRPNIWITGPAGSGKSWVFEELVRAALGGFALAVQGETTEPGLRQLLRNNAMAVVFDEAEADDPASLARMQSILALIRTASTNDGGVTAKGSANGQSSQYQIRSMVSMASIFPQMEKMSDRSRISVLSLKAVPRTEESKAKWEKLKEAKKTLFDKKSAFVARLQTTVIRHLPGILETIKTMCELCAERFGNQRLGDQIGTLMAAAWWLRAYEKGIKRDDYLHEAKRWLNGFDFDAEVEVLARKDELVLLRTILEHTVVVDGATGGTAIRTLPELILNVQRVLYPADEKVTDFVAEQRLLRLGLKIQQGGDVFNPSEYLVISVHSEHVKTAIRGTAFAKNWSMIITRIPGVEVLDTQVEFSGRLKSTAIAIPLELIIGK